MTVFYFTTRPLPGPSYTTSVDATAASASVKPFDPSCITNWTSDLDTGDIVTIHITADPCHYPVRVTSSALPGGYRYGPQKTNVGDISISFCDMGDEK